MKVKNTIPIHIPQLIGYTPDEYSIVLIGLSQHGIDILTIDPDTMGIMSRFPVESEIADQSWICFDTDCLYLPTKLGQILALDKFSGQILTTINPAMPIVSDLSHDDRNVYCVCGVPLSRKWKLVIDNFCLCVFNKETGKKKVQTNYFLGAPCFLTASKRHLWVVAGTYLLQYTKDGELQQKAHLGIPMSRAPIITDDHILLVAADGTVRVLNISDLSFFTIVRGKPNPSELFITQDNKLVWISENGVCLIDYQQQVSHEIKANKKMNSQAELIEHEVFGCDTTGSLVSFNLKSDSVSSIKLSNEPLQNPVKVESYLFVASTTQLHQIEV
ncbi:MAG: hypothetical protein ACXAC5_11730 [Promethearchaeota archaeon]|jgi:hypothetical protein